MPFVVENTVSRARQAALVFDVRKLNGARAYLDLMPDAEDTYVKRIEKINRAKPGDAHGKDCCEIAMATDTKVTIRCKDYRTEMTLKAGSSMKLPCGCGNGQLSRQDVRVSDARWATVGGRELIALNGAAPRIEIPLDPGRVTPLAMVIIPPENAGKGNRYRLDVTQISDGTPTGGVSLVVEAQ